MPEDLVIRPAERDEIPAIVALLADDPLGATREETGPDLPASYYDAFDAIEMDPNNELLVAQVDGTLAGVLQLTFLPSLTYRGGWRAQIEGVRVAAGFRSQGLGRQLCDWAIGRARERGCRLVQLTTDKTRPDAFRFYQELGFRASHEGLKLRLDQTAG